MSLSNNDDSDEGEGSSGLPVARRPVLVGIGATGVLGGGLVAALGPYELTYDATPASLPADVASEHGFDPNPVVEELNTTVGQDLVITSVEADVTSYIYRYDYLGETAADGADQSAGTPSEEGSDGEGDPTTGSATETPAEATPEPPTPTGTATPRETATPAGGTAEVDVQGDPRRDTLTVATTPDADFVGVGLNPAATRDIEKLVETETGAFESACNCTLENPGRVEVRSTTDPLNARLTKEDVGTTVFQIDPDSEGLSRVPSSVDLLGKTRQVGIFAFASPAESIEGTLIVTAKTTGQLGSGSEEAVITSYTDTQVVEQNPPTGLLTQIGSGQPGLFGVSQVESAVKRLTSVCPSIGEVKRSDCEQRKQNLNQLQNRLDAKRQKLRDLQSQRNQAKAQLQALQGQLADVDAKLKQKGKKFDSLFDQLKQFMDAQGIDATTYDKGSFNPPKNKNFIGTSRSDSSQGVGIAFDDPQAARKAFENYEESFGRAVGKDINRMNELQREITELGQKKSSLSSEINSKQSKINDLEKKISNCEDEVEALKEKIAQAKAAYKQCKEKRDVKEEIEDEIDEWETDIKPFIDGFETEITRVKKKVENNKGTPEQKEKDRTEVGEAQDCLDKMKSLKKRANQAISEARDTDDPATARKKLKQAKKLRQRAEQLKSECEEPLDIANGRARSRGPPECDPENFPKVETKTRCLWTGIEEIHFVNSNSRSLTPSEAEERLKVFKDALGGVKKFKEYVDFLSDKYGDADLPTGIADDVSPVAPIEVGKLVDLLKEKWPYLVSTRQAVWVWATYSGWELEKRIERRCVNGTIDPDTTYTRKRRKTCTRPVYKIEVGYLMNQGTRQIPPGEYENAMQRVSNKLLDRDLRCGACLGNESS